MYVYMYIRVHMYVFTHVCIYKDLAATCFGRNTPLSGKTGYQKLLRWNNAF